ncbi:MAG TPA: NAD(P)/FAD-dependent oxidoreductase, partial [Marine Group III euryarchaeote]|nr:NAD(P)/FAD-dependent oxidoreductase [Marine Group III euryarchaeote]
MSNNGGPTRRIIGGGLSGLAAAINFAKNDESVEVHEARKDIGMQFHPNYQVLLKESPETPASESDAKSYLNRWGLNPQFQYKDAKKFLCCTQKRDFT